MKRSVLAKTAICVASLLVFGMFGSGCNQGTPTSTPSTPTEAGTFTGQELPPTVEKLEGTPLYSVSEEIAGLQKLDGAGFLLIAPQDPTKALLVLEPGTTPENLSKRASVPVELSGTKETVEAKELVAHVQERYQLALQVDSSGKVVVLRVQSPSPTDNASAVPTPAANEAESVPAGE